MPGFSHLGIVRTLLLSKYLQLLIRRAEAGSARMMVLVPVAGSWRRVASWQWSLLCCEMMTRSGSGSSRSDLMQGGFLWVEMESLEWKILDGPVIQGSRRTRKGSALTAPGIGLAGMGSKDRKKEASPLRCLTVNAITGRLGDNTYVGRTGRLAKEKQKTLLPLTSEVHRVE